MAPQPKHTSTLGHFSGSPPAPLTQQSLVALRFGFQQPVDAFHGPQLELHVRQVPHHPVEVVGHLRGVRQSPGPIGDPLVLSLGPGMALLTAQGTFSGGHSERGSSPCTHLEPRLDEGVGTCKEPSYPHGPSGIRLGVAGGRGKAQEHLSRGEGVP